MVAMGRVPLLAAKIIINTDVSGTDKIAPGNPYKAVQKTKATNTTKLDKFTDLPIILGSNTLPTNVCTAISNTNASTTGNATQIAEPTYGM